MIRKYIYHHIFSIVHKLKEITVITSITTFAHEQLRRHRLQISPDFPFLSRGHHSNYEILWTKCTPSNIPVLPSASFLGVVSRDICYSQETIVATISGYVADRFSTLLVKFKGRDLCTVLVSEYDNQQVFLNRRTIVFRISGSEVINVFMQKEGEIQCCIAKR